MIDLRNIDCMEYMRDQPDKAFDLCIVDPPYGIGNWIQDTGNKSPNFDKVDWNDAGPDPKYFKEIERVSKSQIIWGANYFNSFNGKLGALIWHKQIPAGSNFSECEIASLSFKKSVDYVSIAWPAGFYRERFGYQIHPCQKPVSLYRWVMEKYSEPGQRILDTHMGSGSSAIAAHYFGVDFVGCEIDTHYFQSAKARIDAETRQIAMF